MAKVTHYIEDNLQSRAQALKLHGMLAHWDEIRHSDWLEKLLGWEESARMQRGLEYRLKQANLGDFTSISDFDWGWPKRCDRELIESCIQLDFLEDSATNIILCGPSGVGKSTIARNIGYQAVLKGHTVLFIETGVMLNDLASQESDSALKRRLKRYIKPDILIADEVGYLSYSNRYADLLFEIISRRYEKHSTLVTTNKAFSEWGSVFPNAACVVSMIDRLVHHSEIITIEGDSFRLHDAKEKREKRRKTRKENKEAKRKSLT